MNRLAILMALFVAACSGGTDAEDGPCPESQCSFHGTCITEDLRPVCGCDTGYAGTSCHECATGYIRTAADTCVLPAECADDTCGDHGTCSVVEGEVDCACDRGYAGVGCLSCAAGFHGDGEGGCVLDRECHENTCSGRGTCTASDGEVSCTCDAGFAGDFCDEGVGCADNDPCGDHGTCIGVSGTARCECDEGYRGALCDACYVGYHRNAADACVLDEICQAGSCSAAGSCDSSSGVAVCTCSAGYTGDICEACAEGYHRDDQFNCVADETCPVEDTCPEFQHCVDSTLEARCECNEGHTGIGCTQCYPGYHHDNDGNCVLDAVCGAATCNGGTCDDAGGVIVCGNCPTGFAGERCQTNIDDCGGVACNGGTCLDLVDGFVCLCPDNSYGAGACM